MKSDGPYKFVKQSMWDYPTISGPGIKGDKKIIGAKEWLEMVNLAYAASRKAESERCAKIAESEPVNQDEWGNIVFGLGEKIAERIRGGQDGK